MAVAVEHAVEGVGGGGVGVAAEALHAGEVDVALDAEVGAGVVVELCVDGVEDLVQVSLVADEVGGRCGAFAVKLFGNHLEAVHAEELAVGVDGHEGVGA